MKLYIFLSLLILIQISNVTSTVAQYGFDFSSPSSDNVCDGTLSITVPSTTELPSFLWSTGENTQTIEGVCYGSYFNATITDSDGCEFFLESGFATCPNYLNYLIPREIIHQYGETKGSIKILLGSGYSYNWENGSTDSEINNLNAGLYRVTLTSPSSISNCNSQVAAFRILKFKPPSIIPRPRVRRNSLSVSLTPPLIINEFSNGLNDQTEYIELLVTGTLDNCDPVDIRGYLIDDNNGDFSNDPNDLSNTGITSGHLQFSNSRIWSEVPKGAIILIYNSAIKNPSILLEDDPFDENSDHIYVLASDHLLLNSNQTIPSKITPFEYLNENQNAQVSPTIPSKNWNTIWMYDQGDAIQVRYPDGEFCHGFSYGNASIINGGPQQLHLDPSHGQGRVFSYSSGDLSDVQNYVVNQVENNTETPGFPNNKNNAIHINSLCPNNVEQSLPNTTIQVPFFSTNGQIITKVFPNPFKDHIQIELYAPEQLDITISVFDFLGKTVLKKEQQIQKGENNFTLNMPSSISLGMYNLLIQSKEEIILDENIIGRN